jgi:hypothetical protein
MNNTMDTEKIINGKELHLKISFKYLTLFQLSPCLDTVLAQASEGLLHRLVQQSRERSGLTGLSEGDRVIVDSAEGRKGPKAARVRLI